MPQATANQQETERFELKTCPQGFVVLRRLTYGEMLDRQDMAAKMAMSGDQKSKTTEATIEMAQGVVTEYEFAHCITEHNLEDSNGTLLNFQMKGIVRTLDPRIGEEISSLIDEINHAPEELLGK